MPLPASGIDHLLVSMPQYNINGYDVDFPHEAYPCQVRNDNCPFIFCVECALTNQCWEVMHGPATVICLTLSLSAPEEAEREPMTPTHSLCLTLCFTAGVHGEGSGCSGSGAVGQSSTPIRFKQQQHAVHVASCQSVLPLCILMSATAQATQHVFLWTCHETSCIPTSPMLLLDQPAVAYLLQRVCCWT